ncbi:MAG: glycosyltransferase [Bacteroidales bacterium]|nr:glycosyltransferase [Bacteroidales bacterium]MCF8336522.1 glycosyltransferase [Bacteroidales bacterium]
MMENQDFICFGLWQWEQNNNFTLKNAAIEISKKNRVLYVNLPINRGELLKHPNEKSVKNRRKVLKGEKADIYQHNQNLWVFTPKTMVESINWIPFAWMHDLLNYMNDFRFSKEIKRAANKLGFQNYILLDDNSMLRGFYLKELLKPRFSIYLLRDLVTQVAYHAKHGTRLEPKLIKKMDLMVANCYYFADYGKKYNKHSYMIGQGVNIELFNDKDDSLVIPNELKDITKRPIIGYVGALTSIRLDIDVLLHIAKQKPEWTLVLIGAEDKEFQSSDLHQLDNVVFLGKKDYKSLPRYIKGIDVLINPQVVNKITDINYPLKIDEWLALGKPVVATKTTFMNDFFKDYTYLADTHREFIDKIEQALQEDNPKLHSQRIDFASSHTWENFVNKIYNHINEVEQEKMNEA